VDYDADTAAVLGALRDGATALCVPPLGDPDGAAAWVATAAGAALPPGASGAADGAVVHVRTGSELPALIRLVRDGVVVAQAQGAQAAFRVERPGLHRAELWRATPSGAPRPWILPSPWPLRT
jgi:hypothetical protein